jgi:hypothetical protein
MLILSHHRHKPSAYFHALAASSAYLETLREIGSYRFLRNAVTVGQQWLSGDRITSFRVLAIISPHSMRNNSLWLLQELRYIPEDSRYLQGLAIKASWEEQLDMLLFSLAPDVIVLCRSRQFLLSWYSRGLF